MAIRNGSQGWWKQKKAQITHIPLEKDAANLSAVNSPILKKIHENTLKGAHSLKILHIYQQVTVTPSKLYLSFYPR